jgi:hypothetical protein
MGVKLFIYIYVVDVHCSFFKNKTHPFRKTLMCDWIREAGVTTHLLYKIIKIKMYKIVILPHDLFGCET